MAEIFRCDCGHRWSCDQGPHSAAGVAIRCPVCGESSGTHDRSLSDTDIPESETVQVIQESAPPLVVPPALPGAIRDAIARLCTSEMVATPSAVADPTPHLPGYEFLSPLGHGGMGVVWLARQLDLDRLVAVKQVAPLHMADSAARARFRHEAISVAQLQHPNIVQIHEISEHDGIPYITLEYIRGGTLAEQLARSSIAYRDAATLIETVARATEYAHSHGVLHRDLKPANILMTEAGVPKICDFGLAKRQAQAASDEASQVGIGTPGYMAPEQAQGIADITSDVYSLGACLYEMLTGRPPFRGETPLETLQQLASQEPVSPSRLASRLPRDLETICLKCLEKDRGRRYRTAADLADDLRRFRGGEPILARPTGALGRLTKWVRRRPASAALLGVVTVAMLAAAAGAIIYQRTLYDAWLRETQLKGVAEMRQRQAELNLDLFREAIDRYYTRVSDNPMLEDEAFAPLRRDLLESARDFYQSLVLKSQDDPISEAALARAYWRLARIAWDMESAESARRPLAQAIAIQERLNGQSSHPNDIAHDLAESLTLDGVLLVRLGQPAESERQLTRAKELREQLRQESPGDARHTRGLATVLRQLGEAAQQLGRLPQAEQYFLQSLELGEELSDKHYDQEGGLRTMAVAHNNLGSLYRTMRQLEKASSHLQQSLELRRRLAEKHAEVVVYQRELATGYQNAGNLEMTLANFAAAETLYRQALAVRSQLVARDPHRISFQKDLAASLNGLGIACHAQGRNPEAEQALRSALDIRESLRDRDPTVLELSAHFASTLHNLGILYESTDRASEAEDCFRRAMETDLGLAEQHPRAHAITLDLIENLISLGGLCQSGDRSEEALAWYAQAVERIDQLPTRAHADRRVVESAIRAQAGKADALTHLHRFAEALPCWDQGLKMAQWMRTRDRHVDGLLAELHARRALTLAQSGSIQEALHELETSIPRTEAPPMSAYFAACAYATIGSAREHAPDEDKNLPASGELFAAAIRHLTHALSAPGFRQAPHLDRFWSAPELDPLRNRPDFPDPH